MSDSVTHAPTLRALLSAHLNEPAPTHEHEHECNAQCEDPCRHAGKVYRYAPVPIPPDHVLLEWHTLPDGGRIIQDIHIDALAAHLSEHPANTPITHASAKDALAKKHADTGKDTGIGQYLDRWHEEGLLP